jgi:hypothetical protein
VSTSAAAAASPDGEAGGLVQGDLVIGGASWPGSGDDLAQFRGDVVPGDDMFARLGAVTELRSRLASDDLPMAAGALAVLTEMARTDIQFVADAARAALREAAVHPAETELHFGRLVQGSPSPHRTIHLIVAGVVGPAAAALGGECPAAPGRAAPLGPSAPAPGL